MTPEQISWNNLKAACLDWSENYMDQWEKFKFQTQHGTVYVAIVMQTPWPDDFEEIKE